MKRFEREIFLGFAAPGSTYKGDVKISRFLSLKNPRENEDSPEAGEYTFVLSATHDRSRIPR